MNRRKKEKKKKRVATKPEVFSNGDQRLSSLVPSNLAFASRPFNVLVEHSPRHTAA